MILTLLVDLMLVWTPLWSTTMTTLLVVDGSALPKWQALTGTYDYFELEQKNCGEIFEKTPFSEQLALNLTYFQQRLAVIGGRTLLQILTDDVHVAEPDVITSYLKTYSALNPAVTESTLLIIDRRNQGILKYSVTRDDRSGTLTVGGAGHATTAANATVADNGQWHGYGGSISETKMFTYMNNFLKGKTKPDMVWQQFCDGRGQRQWRIVLFMGEQTYKFKQFSTIVLYITLPLNVLDLNQCDDSPFADLRSTHACDKTLTKCVFKAGGGFRLGFYKCCCLNDTSSCYNGTSVESDRKTNRVIKWQCPKPAKYGNSAVPSELSDSPGADVGSALPCSNNGTRAPSGTRCQPDGSGSYNVVPGDDHADDDTLRKVLLSINVICAICAFVLIFVAMTHRKMQDWSARGWALMELFLLGAILLYCIVILEFLKPRGITCCLITWCREFGFSLFYGAVVLKIYRNLIEHRVRKAHHVFVKEKDLLKYLSCILAFTVTGLTAWTLTVVDIGETYVNFKSPLISYVNLTDGRKYNVCTMFSWNFAWIGLELALLLYGCYLSYKARNTSWIERKQFSSAVLIEIFVSLIVNILRYNFWLASSLNVLLVLSFVQVHSTVTLIVSVILASKLYYARTDHSNRAHALVSSGTSRAHPSLAKLRDNLVNGAIDFAEVPITEMNPDDIKAELKRVYTQLRMYKLTNLYVDNPHISKRKGGKKTSSKQQAPRRTSTTNDKAPTATSKTQKDQIKRCEAEERSSLARGLDDHDEGGSVDSLTDLTVQSSMHNVYLSRTSLAAAKKLQLDSDLSVRI